METLPKDLIRLLMTTYFDPYTSVQCLLVSKRFYEVVDSDEIRRRAVKYRVWLNRDEQTDGLTVCPKCNCMLKEKNLERHMNKHATNPDMQVRHGIHTQCKDCGIRFPSKNHEQFCQLQLVSCRTEGFYECLTCDDNPQIMPRARHNKLHICKVQCIDCDEVLEAPFEDIVPMFSEHRRREYENRYRHTYNMNGYLPIVALMGLCVYWYLQQAS